MKAVGKIVSLLNNQNPLADIQLRTCESTHKRDKNKFIQESEAMNKNILTVVTFNEN